MKRSEYRWRMRNLEPTITPHNLDAACTLAEELGAAWDPEEPEGFHEWYQEWVGRVGGMFAVEDELRKAWMACLAHQEAQHRAIDHKVDREVRREEIEVQIDAWRRDQGGLKGGGLEASGRALLHRLGVL